jgi:hypothetical protein
MSFVKRSSTSASAAAAAPVAPPVKGGRHGIPANRSHTSKYCDVCYGVGKSFEEYTSHYVKSKMGPDGVVTCPTILNSICTYCKTKGHFKSACEVLKKKNQMGGVVVRGGGGAGGAVAGVAGVAGGAHKKSNEKKRCRDGNMIHTNTYKCLFIGDEDGDSSDEEKTLVERSAMDNSDFPPIPPPLVRSQTNKKPDRVLVTSLKKMSYADALESAVKTFPAAASASSGGASASSIALPCSEEALVAFIQNKPPALVTIRSYNRTNADGTRKSWADSDSEYGSDEDDE